MPNPWLLATRPRTLTAALAPVVVGTALAFADGVGHVGAALAALVGAMLIQIGTNLANDYYDFHKGADTAERLGPVRVTQSGLIAPRTVLLAAIACFAAAFTVGMYLVARGGIPILLLGLAAIACGFLYTGGPFPLAYHGLGDLFVLVFFGPVAVIGTYFTQALRMPDAAGWIVSIPVGALGTMLLVANNLRDIETDRKVDKRTLAVRLGIRASRTEYVGLLVISFLAPVALIGLRLARWPVVLPLICLPLALPPLRLMLHATGRDLIAALAGTAKLQLIFSLLLALGLLLGR